PELSPRLGIASVPYSSRVGSLEGANGGRVDGILQFGTVGPVPSKGMSTLGVCGTSGTLIGTGAFLQVIPGAAIGKVLTSDANGCATWQTPASAAGPWDRQTLAPGQ